MAWTGWSGSACGGPGAGPIRPVRAGRAPGWSGPDGPVWPEATLEAWTCQAGSAGRSWLGGPAWPIGLGGPVGWAARWSAKEGRVGTIPAESTQRDRSIAPSSLRVSCREIEAAAAIPVRKRAIRAADPWRGRGEAIPGLRGARSGTEASRVAADGLLRRQPGGVDGDGTGSRRR